MKEQIISQIIIPVLGVVICTILEVGRRQIKAYLNSKQGLIEKESKALQQSMGIEQYNKDVSVIKQAVQAAEQMGKEFNWTGEMKNSKVLKLIEGKTGLTDEEIYNIIKACVLQVNSLKTVNTGTNETKNAVQSNATIAK